VLPLSVRENVAVSKAALAAADLTAARARGEFGPAEAGAVAGAGDTPAGPEVTTTSAASATSASSARNGGRREYIPGV
jgi:hypothetical protein